MNQPSPHTLNNRRSPFMQTVLIAMFAALSFVAIWLIRIPYPAPVGNPFIHFGNMVTILAALLIGGWQGGLSGSIGMGLFDIVGGYGVLSIKTFILKFGIGLFTGLIARVGRRHPERNPRVGLGVAGGVSLALGLTVLIGKLAGWSLLAKAADISYVLLLIIGYLVFGKKITDETLLSGLSMILAGGLSNLIDRILRGYVVDCLDFTQLINFPVFNFADVCVVMGAAMLIYYVLIEEPKKKKKAAAAVEEQGN